MQQILATIEELLNELISKRFISYQKGVCVYVAYIPVMERRGEQVFERNKNFWMHRFLRSPCLIKRKYAIGYSHAWEPSKPMIYSVPPTRSVSHYYPLLSLHSLRSHRRENLKSYKC
jgi:hypothetical protein